MREREWIDEMKFEEESLAKRGAESVIDGARW